MMREIKQKVPELSVSVCSVFNHLPSNRLRSIYVRVLKLKSKWFFIHTESYHY